MTDWIHVTALPSDEDMPRAQFLLNLDKVFGFNAVLGEAVQVWFSPDPRDPGMNIAETFEEIEVQLGLKAPGASVRPAWRRAHW